MQTHATYTRCLTTIFILVTILSTIPPAYAEDPGSILINEVMYHPTTPESTTEWIELYNPTTSTIDLAGWTIADRTETDTITPDPLFGTDATLQPGGYALLTDRGTTIDDVLSIPDTCLRLSVDDKTLGNGLGNTHDSLTLADPTGTVIDAIEWGTDDPDITGTPAPLSPPGHSLSRLPDQDTDDTAADFTDTPTPTPGAPNTPTDTTSSQDPNIIFLRITQAYPHTHPGVHNEFIAITNPTNTSIDLARCSITDEPTEPPQTQTRVTFPTPSLIPANTTWTLTANATWYAFETGNLPTYEWTNAQPAIPLLISHGSLGLSNTAGTIALTDPTGTCIDLLCYGNTTVPDVGWNGDPLPAPQTGVILTRNTYNGTPLDTDSAADWTHPRVFHIGQTNLLPLTLLSDAQITCFVSPDCSYPVITAAIDNATTSLLLNMYEFTNTALAQHLLDALERGVNVSILLEGSPVGGITTTEQAIASTLTSAGASLRFLYNDPSAHIYARYRYDHAKYLVVDNTSVVLTSGNWAMTGVPIDPSYGNREWGVAITDSRLASYFTDVFTADFNPDRCDSVTIENMNFTVYQGLPSGTVPTGSYHPRFQAMSLQEQTRLTPIFSPDTSETFILQAMQNATQSIYIQQLEMSLSWNGVESPFLVLLKEKAAEGLDVRLFLNDNPSYSSSAADIEAALNGTGIKVQLCSTDKSPFSAIHNKGMIIDNRTVLISSVNWNEVSVRDNREAAVLIDNPTAAAYFTAVYLQDWTMAQNQGTPQGAVWGDFKNIILIVVVVTVAVLFIAYDWRRRRW